MAITYELIGQLGGAEVEKIPVSATASGAYGSEVVMHTVNVPAGETWLIALIGTLTPRYTNSNGPTLHVGDAQMGPSLKAGLNSVATEQSGAIVVKIKRNNNVGQDLFDGHVYAVKI